MFAAPVQERPKALRSRKFCHNLVMATKEGQRVGELAAEFGLNPKTLRYYEEIGLLPASDRTPAGYRIYREADRRRLEFILKARAIGLTLEEIGQVLSLRRDGVQPCGHVADLLDEKVAAVDEQLRALAEFRADLVSLRETAAANGSCDGTVCGIIEHSEPTQPPALLARGKPAVLRHSRS